MARPSQEIQPEEVGASDYLVWEPPGAPAAVRIHLEAVDAISVDAIDGFNALRRRGVEVGGILLGRKTGQSLVIERCERVPCEYRFGPSYILSDQDKRNFDEIYSRLAGDSRHSILGYYRSHTRPNLQLEPSDLEIIERHFKAADSVFLLVKPLDVVRLVGEYFFWQQGKLPMQSADRKFAFTGRGQSATAGLDRLDFTPLNGGTAPVVEQPPLQVVPAALEENVPERRPEIAAVSQQRRPPRPLQPLYAPTLERGFFARYWEALAALVLVLCAAGLFFWQHWGNDDTDAVEQTAASQAPVQATLGLEVQPSPGAWRVSWKRDLPAIQKANRAVLAIEDGGSRHEIALDPNQLRSGGIPYRHIGDDVSFRLEVFGPENQSSSESFRVLLAEAPTRAVALPTPKAVQPSANAPITAPVKAAPAPKLPLPAASTIPDRGPAATTEAVRKSPSAMAQVPDLPKPAVVERSAAGHRLVPATVLQRVRPEITEGIKSRILQDTIVMIKVDIDATGEVVHAIPITHGDGLVSYLSTRAAEAAKHWRFEPARANGEAVPSSQVIRFVFEK